MDGGLITGGPGGLGRSALVPARRARVGKVHAVLAWWPHGGVAAAGFLPGKTTGEAGEPNG
jgi:hypothetical protein